MIRLLALPAAIFLQVTPALDLPTLIDGVTRLGATGLLAIWLWMMLTDRLMTPKRLDEANARAEKAEKQRDEAMAGWEGQVAATNKLAAVNESVLDFVRSALAKQAGT